MNYPEETQEKTPEEELAQELRKRCIGIHFSQGKINTLMEQISREKDNANDRR